MTCSILKAESLREANKKGIRFVRSELQTWNSLEFCAVAGIWRLQFQFARLERTEMFSQRGFLNRTHSKIPSNTNSREMMQICIYKNTYGRIRGRGVKFFSPKELVPVNLNKVKSKSTSSCEFLPRFP